MITAILKRIPLVAKINRVIKSAQTKSFYCSWCKRYGSPCVLQASDRTTWVSLFTPDGFLDAPEPARTSVRRFFFVSSSWDQDRSGLVQGLQAHGEVGVFRGPDNKNELRMSSNPAEMAACREANKDALEAEFDLFAGKGPVSALIGQMWNFSVPAATLARIRASGVPVINIGMDDRHSFHKTPLADGSDGGVAGIVGAITLGATAAPECVSWYKSLGTPAIFFPEASDPLLFRVSSRPKIHDITFVGASYGFRSQVVSHLRRAGLRVTTYGSGWPEGRIETEAIPELFACSRIVLGIGAILHCSDFTTLKLRDFDAPMSGSFYLTQENPDLGLVFEIGAEIETWRDLPQLVDKCRRYLADSAARERVAAAGRARAVAEHTWARRFSVLLRQLDAITPLVRTGRQIER